MTISYNKEKGFFYETDQTQDTLLFYRKTMSMQNDKQDRRLDLLHYETAQYKIEPHRTEWGSVFILF